MAIEGLKRKVFGDAVNSKRVAIRNVGLEMVVVCGKDYDFLTHFQGVLREPVCGRAIQRPRVALDIQRNEKRPFFS